MIMNRTEGSIHDRARRASIIFGLLALALFTLGGIWVSRLNGYVITGGALPNGAANPLHKTVEIVSGAWLNNFRAQPVLWILPLLTYAGIVIGVFMLRKASLPYCLVAGSPWLDRDHRDGLRGHVPLSHAVRHTPLTEPDGVGCLFKPYHPCLDAGRCGYLRTCGHRLHKLGFLGHEGKGHGG